MKKVLFVVFLLNLVGSGYAQNDHNKTDVYRIRPLVNYPIIVGGLVANYFGIRVLKGKRGVNPDNLSSYTPDDINAFDRGAALQDPSIAEGAMKLSDVLMIGSFALPGLLLIDKEIRHDAYELGVLFLTSSAIVSNAYSWGVGHIHKFRPYVYNPNESFSRRTRNGSRNSFYGGHPAATASATFFLVKVYHDYHPGSNLTPYLYGAAIIPPAVVGYLRYKSGMHFPSDIIVGITAGAFMGTIIPHIHKRKSEKLSLYPIMGPANGLGLIYSF